MDTCINQANKSEQSCRGHKTNLHPNCSLMTVDVFDAKVFYVRACNFMVDESTPQNLTLIHIPLTHDTVLEVNGKSCIYSSYASSLLQRDRVDKRSQEIIFVSTDSIKMTGRVQFEVYDQDYLLLAGVFELSNDDRTEETKYHDKKCSMNFQSIIPAGIGFLKSKQYAETKGSMVEVVVAGCFSGNPIILSKTLQLCFSKKQPVNIVLDTILENKTTGTDMVLSDNFELSKRQTYESEADFDVDYKTVYSKAAHFKDEGGELSWFNAGVRVGVGLGLGICLGVGIGVGLLVRTYQAASRNLKRRPRLV